MDRGDFVRLVERMRLLQKLYFRRRTAELLDQSKQLEAEVDKRIADFKGGQKKLFDQGEK